MGGGGLTLDDLAGLHVPAQEARVRVGDDDAGGALLQSGAGIGSGLRCVAGEGDEGVVEVAGLGGSDAGLADRLQLLEVGSLHLLEAAIFAVEDDIVDTDCDGCGSGRDQSGARSEGEDLGEVHVERVTGSMNE